MLTTKTNTEQNQSLAGRPHYEELKAQRKDEQFLSTFKKMIRVYKHMKRLMHIYDAINLVVTLLSKFGFWSWLGTTLAAVNPLFFLCAFPPLLVVLFWMMDRQIRKGTEGSDNSK